MGCAASKVEDLPAVALCRERSNLLEAAIRHRYALSQAHLSYLHSLKSLSSSLHRFFDLHYPVDLDRDLIKPSSSSPIPAVRLSRSSSGSHIHFQSDNDSDASESPLHDPTLEQNHPRYYAHYEQSRSTEAVRFEGSYPNPSTYYSYSSYSDPYPNYAGIDGLYSHSAAPSRPPAPPPPPPPPTASTWDFLNPFEAYVSYCELMEVRKEEGMPDSEGGNYLQEVVKEVDGGGHGGYLGVGGGGGEVEYEVQMVDKKVVVNEERVGEEKGGLVVVKAGGMRGVSEVVSEIKVQFDRASESGGEVAKILEVGKHPYRGRNAVYKVSSRMLDVVTPLSIVSSQLPASKGTAALPSSEKSDSFSMDFEEDMGMNSNSLSSTLQKLYIWEKKLCEEVKVEEKMRIIHERKCRKLKYLDESGAEAPKIESTRTSIRKLSMKIRIALQSIDSISNTINKLRDEDLCPQIHEFIQGLVKMWKVMLECHQNQCQIIAEAGNLDVVTSGGKLSNDHMEATMQLEQELLNWILSYYAWIGSLKSYVKALNGWLLMCIQYEPEETADGIMPFSPGRIGAPPVFAICNHWSQVMDRISEKEVFEAMRAFSVSVLQLWNQYYLEQRQRLMANKDIDGRLKFLEREEQKMQKSLDIINKKLTLVSEQNGLPPPGQIVHQSHSDSDGRLQLGLRQIFEAMERFSNNCMKAYEELCLRSEEERVDKENAGANMCHHGSAFDAVG